VRRTLPTLLLSLVACAKGDPPPGAAAPGGTMIIATSAEADQVLPPLVATSVGKQVSDALFLPIARIGDEMNMLGDEGFIGVLADRWEWSGDSLSIRFTLDAAARWHDGRPIRADDVAFSFGVYTAPATGSDAAPRLSGIAAVTADDSLAFTVRFARRSATQFYDVVHHLIPLPRHQFGAIPAESLRASTVARAPIGSGKFRFGRWEAGQRLEVIADTTHWLGRPALDRVVWTVVPDPNTQLAQLLAGEADLVENLPAPALQQATADSMLAFLQLPAVNYVAAQLNLRARRGGARPHPLLGDVRVRQALTLALDRPTLARSVLDTLGSAMDSPYLAIAGVRGLAFARQDLERARALLAEAGFTDGDGDGVLERGNVPLAFAVSAPSTSTGRVRMQTLLVDAWKALGARVTAERMDNPTMMARNEAGDFDVSLLGFTGSASASDVRPQWGSSTAGQGTNWGGYSNPVFDARLDSAAAALDPQVARQHYARAGQVLIDDAPAIWLYEVRTVAGFHRRIRPAPIRADAWWAHLDEWSVDPTQLLPRDRIGSGAPRTP
jgi:peptide/nickel transport system substrate-binding protein